MAQCRAAAGNDHLTQSGRLRGQTALITGASAGIGRACALALAGEGAEVIATGRDQGRLEAVAAEIGQSGGKTWAIAGDLTDYAFVTRLVEQAGSLDILVNNAGILTYAPFIELPSDEIDAMVRTNLLGPLHLTQKIAAGMAERGRGHIIMITSGAARTAVPLGLVYSATKHAMSAAGRVLRIELQSRNVRVTEIAPGTVDTGIRERSERLGNPAYRAKMSARKFKGLPPADVAAAVVYAATTSESVATNLIEIKSHDQPAT